MGRKSTFEDASVFAAVGASFMHRGDARLKEIVADTGVSIGSLYHRYGSREGLLAEAWLDALGAFHEMFLTALTSDNGDAGEAAALATPRFCRAERNRAVILACCRKSEFISKDAPAALRRKVDNANEEVAAAIKRYARSNGYSLLSCRLGMVAFPLAAVRMYLPERPVPGTLDAYVRAAYRSAVEIDASR